MSRHNWTKDDIRLVFATCKANNNHKDRIKILQSYFPDCSLGSITYAIVRYQKRADNTMEWDPENGITEGYGSNGKIHDEVWSERNWKPL